MGTTLKDELARIGRQRDPDDLDQTLKDVHRSLADTVALLDLEIEDLWKKEADVEDQKRYDKLRALVREANTMKSQIAAIRAKSVVDKLDEKTALNLEDARDEILRRLARLAAAEGTGEISG